MGGFFHDVAPGLLDAGQLGQVTPVGVGRETVGEEFGRQRVLRLVVIFGAGRFGRRILFGILKEERWNGRLGVGHVGHGGEDVVDCRCSSLEYDQSKCCLRKKYERESFVFRR